MENEPDQQEWTGEDFQKHCHRATELALNALTTDGAHHKQWYLEQIIRELGINPEHFTEKTGIEWDRGIAP